MFLEQFRIAENHGKQVVEVVGDAAGELADRLQSLRLLKLFFQRETLGDVGVDGEDRFRFTVVVADQAPARLGDHPVTVGVVAAETTGPLAVGQQCPGGRLKKGVLLTQHRVDATPQRLILAPAVDGLGGLIPVTNAALQIEHHDGIAGLVQQGGLAGQIGQEPAPLGDIAHAAHHPQGVAVFVADHIAPIRHIGHAAVLAHKAVFGLPFLLLAVDDPFDVSEHSFLVVGVDARGPGATVVLQVVGAVAEQRLHTFAPPQAVGGGIPIPDRVGGGAGRRFEAHFLLAQGAGRVALFADILESAVHADNLAGTVEHRLAQGAYPEGLAAGVENLELLVVGDTVVHAGRE